MDLPPDIWFSEPGRREFLARRLQVADTPDCATFREWCDRSALSPLLTQEIVRLFDGGMAPDAARLSGVTIEDLLTYVYASHEFYNRYYLQYFEHFASHLLPSLHAGPAGDRVARMLTRLPALFRRHMQEEESSFLPYVRFLKLEAEFPRFSAAQRFALLKRSPLASAQHADEEEHRLLALLLRSVYRIRGGDRQFHFPWERMRRLLADFRTDLHIHAFIEEEVLLPRALCLEDAVSARLAEEGLRN